MLENIFVYAELDSEALLALRTIDGVEKVLNSTGFIRFCDMLECHVTFSEIPNAF